MRLWDVILLIVPCRCGLSMCCGLPLWESLRRGVGGIGHRSMHRACHIEFPRVCSKCMSPLLLAQGGPRVCRCHDPLDEHLSHRLPGPVSRSQRAVLRQLQPGHFYGRARGDVSFRCDTSTLLNLQSCSMRVLHTPYRVPRTSTERFLPALCWLRRSAGFQCPRWARRAVTPYSILMRQKYRRRSRDVRPNSS